MRDPSPEEPAQDDGNQRRKKKKKHKENSGLQIEVHHPSKDPERGSRLAPGWPWPVHMVAEYDDGSLPEAWERGSAGLEAYFVGVERERELWFDFHPMNAHSHFVAVIPSVQSVNAVTGQPIPEGVLRLEQYKTRCPVHDIEFTTDRFCAECGWKWPHQN